jgi:hypothetical protein
LAFVLLCGVYSVVSADIYEWTDEHGVKHFTNYAPPAQAKVLMKTKEIAYDEAADKERMEAERQERLVAAWQEIAEKEAWLIERQQEADQRIAQANRKAEEALQQAEAALYEAENYDNYAGRNYVFYGYYPYAYKYSHYQRWYYRNHGSISKKRPHYKHRLRPHYKRSYRQQYYGGYHKKHHFKQHHLNHKQRYHLKPRARFKTRRHFNGHRFRGHSARFGRFR